MEHTAEQVKYVVELIITGSKKCSNSQKSSNGYDPALDGPFFKCGRDAFATWKKAQVGDYRVRWFVNHLSPTMRKKVAHMLAEEKGKACDTTPDLSQANVGKPKQTIGPSETVSTSAVTTL